MSPARTVIALGVCSVLTLLQVWQCTAERDDWPLSSFPMYSVRQSSVQKLFSLFAVTESGEVKLAKALTEPYVGPRLERVLRTDFDGGVRAVAENLCRNISRLSPELRGDLSPETVVGLRVYRLDWKISPSLQGAKGKGKVRAQVPVLCPERKAQLERQLTGGTNVGFTRAPAGSVVLEADGVAGQPEASTTPRAGNVQDVRASQGRATVLDSGSSSASVRLEFQAPKGTYNLWVRVRADSASKASLRVQANDQIDTTAGTLLDSVTRPAPGYPDGVYAWISSEPGRPPTRLELPQAAQQSLQVTVVEGRAVVDQVLLTPGWPEPRVDNSPVMP